MRNGFILLILGLWLFASCGKAPQAHVQQPPNILWIVAEDLSPDLACYGHPLVQSPHIDELANQGVRFTHAFTTAPVCAPSRTALATGMYQTSLDAHHMRYPDELKNELPKEVIPLNELMRRQGYQTANIKDAPGKGKQDWSFRSDIAHYDVANWDSLSADKPFFAVINLRLTHRPFEQDTLNPIDPNQVQIPPYYPDHIVSRRDWAQYLETVQVLDALVGTVRAELKRRNYDKNTIVFFFSDHGRPMTRAKNYHYDSGYRIPLIIYSPKELSWRQYLPPATVDERLISAIDLSATTLAMAGAKKPDWMQGRIILGKEREAERQYIYCANDRIGETFFKARSVRSRKYKYIRNFNHNFSVNSSATAYRKQMHPIYHLLNILDEQGKLTPEQSALVEPMEEELLFDLEADPFEVHNLVEDAAHQDILEEMRKELARWQSDTRDHGMNKDSEAIVEAFEQYGIQSQTSRSEKIKAAEQAVREEIKSLND